MKKKMNEAHGCLLQPLLCKFYLISSVCENYMGKAELRDVFGELSRVFFVDDSSDLQGYLEASTNELFSAISDFQSYERFCRTLEFAENSGQSMGMTTQDRVILAQKREAMMTRSALFGQCKNLTKENVSAMLQRAANIGSVEAMSLLGYLEYHGICMPQDRKNAIKNIRRSAKWNDLFSNLMGLLYDPENISEYVNRLRTIMSFPSLGLAFDEIIKRIGYTDTVSVDRVAKLVHNACGRGLIKRDVYDRAFSKVAFSDVVSIEDKEKLLCSNQKEAIASLNDIPFDMKHNEKVSNGHEKSELALIRESEIRMIRQNLAVASECPREVYRPLLIISSDEYIVNMYRDMLYGQIGEKRIVEIDAGTLCAQDISPTRENVILRGLCETKDADTVFFIKNCDEMGDDVLEGVCRMLEYDYRKKYRLFSPSVSLDLSDIGFVLFATEQNIPTKALSVLCDTVRAKKISIEEKEIVINSVFEKRKAAFAYQKLEMEQECLEYLRSFTTSQIQEMIDAALRSAVFDKKCRIGVADIKSACEENNITSARRGFGYTGGVSYA